jgi:hypothetical protein
MNDNYTKTVLFGVVAGTTMAAVIGFALYVYYQQVIVPKLAAAGSNPISQAEALL